MIGDLQNIKQQFAKYQGMKETLERQLEQEQERLLYLNKRLAVAQQARNVIKATALQTQKQLEYHINALVSSALAAVFPEPYEFQARFVERRNRIECDFVLLKDGEEFAPGAAAGGGVIDITSFGLRIAFWSLRKNAPVFFMDEPFKFLSLDYQAQASEMLKMISERLGIQFIMVSHLERMIEHADKTFTIKDGKVING